MASAQPSTDIEQEVKCPICKEYLANPVSVDCGHIFCKGCITNYCEIWESMKQLLECPLCKAPIKKESLRPNWQLANIVEELRHLPLKTAKDNLCVKHKKELHLFCKEDMEIICVACERSPEHRTHVVILLEEAAKEYKVKIQANVQALQKQIENCVGQKLDEEQRTQTYLAHLATEKHKVKSTFEQMETFLEEKKSFWLAQLGDLEQEIEKRREENVTRLSEEISSLTNLIKELEGKCQQPGNEFLQDIRNTLTRYQKGKVRQPLKPSENLEQRLRNYSLQHSVLKGTVEKYEASLKRALNIKYLAQPLNKVNVTLDPGTANPFLVLSEDLRSVRWGDRKQSLPDNSERFDSGPFVLGCERFASGRHWWEVEVQAEVEAKDEQRVMWAVGVARESVTRKRKTFLDPKKGIWAVGMDTFSPSEVLAFTTPEHTHLTLRRVPGKIQIFLDYEKGRVDFFDAHTNEWIFTFSLASFFREKIRPFFGVYGAIRLKC